MSNFYGSTTGGNIWNAHSTYPRPKLRDAMTNSTIDQLIRSVREAKIILDNLDDIEPDDAKIRLAKITLEEALDSIDITRQVA